MDQSIINFAVYENGKEYIGLAKATLPEMNWLTQVISGAGIAGNLEAVILGHIEAMTLTLDFRTPNSSAAELSAPRRHNIDLRIAQQDEETTSADLIVRSHKHVFVVIPKSYKPGTVAPASPSDGSGEYAVHYWAEYIDGVKVREIDPVNTKCEIDGVDYLAPVRKALGK